MGKTNITAATTTQCETGAVPKIRVQLNAALTGTITVIDNTTGSTPVVATITNPGATAFEYWDFQTGVRIITSAVCDVTVNTSSTRGPK